MDRATVRQSLASSGSEDIFVGKNTCARFGFGALSLVQRSLHLGGHDAAVHGQGDNDWGRGRRPGLRGAWMACKAHAIQRLQGKEEGPSNKGLPATPA